MLGLFKFSSLFLFATCMCGCPEDTVSVEWPTYGMRRILDVHPVIKVRYGSFW